MCAFHRLNRDAKMRRRWTMMMTMMAAAVILAGYSCLDVWMNGRLQEVIRMPINGTLDRHLLANIGSPAETIVQCEQDRLQEHLTVPTLDSMKQAIQYIPWLRNPCWVETFGDKEMESVKNNPYQYTVFEDKYVKKFNSYVTLLYNMYRERLLRGRRTRLRCIPYFYIIGQPKSGTTDLYKKLSFHPNIRRGVMKETHWWRFANTGVFTQWWIYDMEFSNFVDLFGLAAAEIENRTETQCQRQLDNQNSQMIIGDGSAFTMDAAFDTVKKTVHTGYQLPKPITVPQFFKWLSPNLKFLVVLREPVERLYSAYTYFSKQKTDFKGPWDFHELALKAILTYSKCMKDNGNFPNCSKQQRLFNNEMALHHGLYAYYLEEWFSVFGRGHFLVLRMEDYSRNMRQTLKSVYRFLGVHDLSREEEMAVLNTKIFNSKKHKIQPMLNSTMKMLTDFYAPHNKRLARLLNDPTFLWPETFSQYS